MIKDVLQQDNPLLGAENNLVEIFDNEIKTIIKDLFETMEATNLSGLAAPQIGNNVKIFVCQDARKLVDDDKSATKFVFINPKILTISDAIDEWHEGCGSVQHGEVFGIVERPKRVRIQAQNEKGDEFTLKAEGFLARVIQHEFDHLNGVLFIDKLKPGSKLIRKEEYLELRRKEAEAKKAASN